MSQLYTAYAQHDDATIIVSTSDELNAAVEALTAQGGGTILVDGDGGPYELWAENAGGLDAPILIKAVDATNPPTFHTVSIEASSYLTLTEMRIDSSEVYGIRADYLRDINVAASNNIEIVNNDMSSVADGYLDGTGSAIQGESCALIRDSENITFSHNTLTDYYFGVTVTEVDGLIFSGNELSGIQGDGLRGGGIQNAVISNNYMHDFYGTVQTLNHSDMIQIWGGGAETISANIEISGNILDSANGSGTQSIFIRNENFGESGETGGYYQNIVIHNNVVHNSSAHGISVSDTQGLEIYENTVLWNELSVMVSSPGSAPVSRVPEIRLRNTLDSDIHHNFVGRISVDETEYVGDNFVVSYTDYTSAMFVHNHVVNLSGAGDLDLRDLRITNDSPANGKYGADASWFSASTAPLEASISISEVGSDRQTVELTAEYSLTDGTPIDPSTAQFIWTFDDGTTMSGVSITPTFETAGEHSVTLTVITNDGQTETLTRVIEVRSNEIFELNFGGTAQDTSQWDSIITVEDPNGTALTATGTDGTGFHLDGDSLLTIDRDNLQLFELDSFAIEFDLKLDTVAQDGALIRMSGTMDLFLNDDGSLFFRLFTDEGAFEMVTPAAVLDDTQWHTIAISYDSNTQVLNLIVDDQVVDSMTASGTTASAGYHGLNIGDPWAESVHAVIDNFTMSTEPVEGWTTGGTTPSTTISSGSVQQSAPPAGLNAELLYESQDGLVIEVNSTDPFTVGRDNDFLFGRDDFRIELTLETQAAGVEGVFLYMPKSMVAEVDPQGHIRFTLTTSDGEFELRSSQAVFEEPGKHDIAIIYDAQLGYLQIEVDGLVQAQTEATGTTSDETHWGLTVGNKWSDGLDGTFVDFEFYGDATMNVLQLAPSNDPADHRMSFEGAVHDEIQNTTVFRDMPGQAEYVTGTSGQAYHLNGTNSIGFERGEVALNDSDSFTVSFDFQLDTAGESGRVMHLHEVMDTYIDDNGFMHVELTTDEGTYHLISETTDFDDQDWHTATIAYDSEQEILSLEIDDQITLLNGTTGTTADASNWGLTIGSAWGESIEGNVDNFVFIDEVEEEYLNELLLV
ncbi:LamG-like jellyroll fold domain-containing protein [Actibacterium lipolyticum]|uniref:Laminin G domain protein n=1 Tax=Actibacterium lipolyticum TaxID=1524263 RepID=A0A238KUD6_9RHOB|nr:LamG domain-containing protein [Actibacterium lipolyticum]SMX46474.1 Laminin G domain protein [Actibacterium lipolyticum]